MKMKASWRAAVCLLALPVAAILAHAETVISSFDQNGTIRWQVSSPPTTCRVEWASSVIGPWRQSWESLNNIIVTGTSGVAAVPMFFRIVQGTNSMDPGLVFHMPCNGDLLDHSPYGNNPTPTGAVDLDEDRVENLSSALRLDSGEYLTVPGNASLMLTNATVALWAKMKTSTWMHMIEMGPAALAWSLFIDQSGGTPPNLPWHFYVRGGGPSPAIWTSPVLVSNQWYHFAATFNGTQTVLYQNGLPAMTGTVPAVSTAITTLYIGRSANNSVPNYFNGTLDDIRIYNRALSAAEVAQIHASAP